MSEIALPPIAVVAEHAGTSHNRGSVYTIGSDVSEYAGDSNRAHLKAGSTSGARGETIPPPISVRPFSPSESWSFPQPPVTPPGSNGGTIAAATSNFASVETIVRPFNPTLPDELAVVSGDFVRVIKAFDDNWALVEKYESVGNSFTGLIPIGCLNLSENNNPRSEHQ
jgi:hypothetical protein